MKAQRTLEFFMIEDGRVLETRQYRLCGSGLAGFAADAFPNGITVLHLLDAVALCGCHQFCSAALGASLQGGKG